VSGYGAIKDEVLRRVRMREWRAGEVIPGEVELASAFGVSRATMNRALRELSEEGVLERRRNAGTRVVSLPVRQARLAIPLIRREIEETGARYGYRLLASRRAASADMDDALHLECLHLADDAPFLLETRRINLAVVAGALAADFAGVPPNEWLVEAMPFTEADFAFSATAAKRDEAKLLGVRQGAPLFVSERTTWLADAKITVARMAYRPGHRMVTRI
jgi:GntR family transcriptional regulator, histidine utilization repressor